jgi:hypothetical protein
MGVSLKASPSNYTPKGSDDVSLDSASTMVDKQETKIKNFSTSPAKRMRQRSALSFRRPNLLSESNSAPSASTCHIRQRYLSKLGVAEAASPKLKSTANSKQKLKPVLKSSDAFLKPTSPKANVRFQAQVSVQILPDKHVPNKDLWFQKDEFQELFQRGCLEYAADGWSCEHATEESDFLWYKNELIHPAHFRGHNACTMQRHFLMNMYAQRQSGF